MTSRTVAELLADPRHAGSLDGADRVGEAGGGERLVVRVGLWLGEGDRVVRARYRVTSCAALIAYAEAACALAEGGGAAALAPDQLRRAVRGVHPVHRDRADLVARAFARAVAVLERSPEIA